MADKNAPPAGKGRGRRITRSRRTAANGSPVPGPTTNRPPVLGTRIEYREDCCSAAGDATYTDKLGYPDWLIGSRSTRCPGGGACLSRLGDALGLGLGATKDQIAAALRARGQKSRRAEVKPL